MQCDFDTIGVTEITADIEMALVINDLFTALGIEKFSVRVNHRAVLNGMLEKLGVADRSAAGASRARQARQDRREGSP